MNVQNYPSHQQFQHNVKHSITTLYAEGKIKSITHYTELIGKMFLSDLTEVRQLTGHGRFAPAPFPTWAIERLTFGDLHEPITEQGLLSALAALEET